MGIQQPAGRDYVQSKEYSSMLLNKVSKVREIPIRYGPYHETRPVSKSKIFGRISSCEDFPNF